MQIFLLNKSGIEKDIYDSAKKNNKNSKINV